MDKINFNDSELNGMYYDNGTFVFIENGTYKLTLDEDHFINIKVNVKDKNK